MQFGLRHLLLFTTLVAIVVGLFRSDPELAAIGAGYGFWGACSYSWVAA